MKIEKLRKLQLEFEKIRKEIKIDFNEIEMKRKDFVRRFPINSLINLAIDDFVIGKGKDNPSFCNRLENELNKWGNIHGSNARKFGLYYGRFGKNTPNEYRFVQRYGSSPKEALKNILQFISVLLNKNNDLEIIKKIPLSPMFKGKLLSVYFPDSFLNIFSATHLNYFINSFGLINQSISELDKQALLLEYKNADCIMKDWSVYEFSRFLYSSFGYPNSVLKKTQLNKELLDYLDSDFPPIEIVHPVFLNLELSKLDITDNENKNTSRKTDYVQKTKRNIKIGQRGEQIVFIAETEFLRKNGRHDLADRVEPAYDKNPNAGYDIVSYDLEGSEKYIEVKSTHMPEGINNIFITSNELEVARKSNYFFYIVFEVDSKQPKIGIIKSNELLNNKNILIKPTSYKIMFNTKVSPNKSF